MRSAKQISIIAVAALGILISMGTSQPAFAGVVAYGACMASPVTEDNRGFLQRSICGE